MVSLIGTCSETMVSYAMRVSELEKLVKRMVFDSDGVAKKHYDLTMELRLLHRRTIHFCILDPT